MKKKFITNLSLLLLVNLLVKPFWIFGIDRSVQNLVGSSEYGFFFSLFSFTLLLNIIPDLGITNYNNRNIARHPGLMSKYLGHLVPLRLILGLAYVGIAFLGAWFIGYDQRQFSILWILLINQFMASFILYLRSNLSGLHLFRTDSLVSVLDRTLMVIIVGVLLLGEGTRNSFRIEWFVYAQTLGYLLTGLFVFGLVLYQSQTFKPALNWKVQWVVLKNSLPYAILILLMSVYYRIDAVMLERMLPSGSTEAGLYAQAFRILDAVVMFAFLFGTLLLPMFSRMIKKGEPTGELVQLSFTLLMVPVFTLVVATTFFSKELMALLYTEQVAYSHQILIMLMISFAGISVSYVYGTLLTAHGSLKPLIIFAIGSVVLNVILNLFLIPQFKALGSAIASMITQLLMAGLQIFYAQKLFQFRIHVGLIFKFLSLIVIGMVLALVLKKTALAWAISFVSIIFVMGLVAMISGLLKPSRLISILAAEQVD